MSDPFNRDRRNQDTYDTETYKRGPYFGGDDARQPPPSTSSISQNPSLPAQSNPATPPPALSFQQVTPEDMTLLRNVKTGSFLTRVLPLGVLSNGALYLYYKNKNVPQRLGPHFGVALLSYYIGSMLTFKKYIVAFADSNLTTPMAQQCRAMLGRPPKLSSEEPYGMHGDLSSSNWDQPYREADGFGGQSSAGFGQARDFRASSGHGQEPRFSPDRNYGPRDQDMPFGESTDDSRLSPDAQRRPTYEELRARNRGYTR